MAEYFAGGHLHFVNGEWRDDNGDAIEISHVRHGRLSVQYIDDYYGEFADCMECGTDNILPCNYCRNCGAKMDGVDDG